MNEQRNRRTEEKESLTIDVLISALLKRTGEKTLEIGADFSEIEEAASVKIQDNPPVYEISADEKIDLEGLPYKSF